MFVQFRSSVDRRGLDGSEEHLCGGVWRSVSTGGWELLTGNTGLIDVYEMWLEHALWCLEPLLANFNDTTIRQLHSRISKIR